MKTFRQYLQEKNLTYDEAKKIFGITSDISTSELKSKYKQLALKNHPDRGGSVTAMQDINQAYEILSNKSSGTQSRQSSRDFWKDQREKEAKETANFEKYITPIVRKNLNGAKFVAYLQGIFNQPFKEHTSYGFNKGSYSGGYFWVKSIYRSEDGENFVTVESTFFKPHNTGGLSASENDFNFTINVLILAGTKKIKLTPRTYTSASDISTIGKPEILLPKDKFVKQLSKKSSKKFSKKDALLMLKNKLDAVFSDNGDTLWIYIPLAKEMSSNPYVDRGFVQALVLYRTTIMRGGHYGINSLKGSDFRNPVTKSTHAKYMLKHTAFTESEEAVINFINIVKQVQYKGMTPDNVHSTLQRELSKMRS